MGGVGRVTAKTILRVLERKTVNGSEAEPYCAANCLVLRRLCTYRKTPRIGEEKLYECSL